MTTVYGNSGNGGTTGALGHRTVVTYTITQSVAGNYSDIAWQYGVDYGDPNYWNNISNRSIAWSLSTGASLADIAGEGRDFSSAGFINTSDPGYGGQLHYFTSGTVRIYHDSNGEAVIHLAASMSFNSSAYTSSISQDVTLPDIVQAPTAPGTPTASRVNDGQIDLSWTNNSSSHHEYASLSVQRSRDGGAYSTIASGLSEAATSYSDTSTSANHKYTYRIVAANDAGSATSSASTAAYTTPGAPSGLVATKLANGNIQLDWSNNVNYGDTAYTVRIEESQNGGAFSELTSVSGGVATYEHASPSTLVTHAYRVRARSTTGSLNSSYSGNSNTVTLLSTASAPTGLSPSGAAQDAAGNITLSWTHNPTDGTPQSKRRVQVKVNAGAYTDVVNDSSGSSSYTISGGTWTNGDTITWKVATAGQNGTLSAFSAEASFTLSAAPTVTINEPDDVYDTSLLTVEWGYFQAQASAQAAWQASLYDANDALLETISGTTETQGTFTHTLADATTYTVTVTVTSAAGVASIADTQEFTVAYLLPAAIVIEGTFDNTAGATVLTLTGEAASPGYSGLTLDGTGDYASTPDAAALDITGDIDIRLDVWLEDWTPAADIVLISKWAAPNQRSWLVVLTTVGLIKFYMTTDGTSGTIVSAESAGPPTPIDGRLSLRIDRNSGVVTFRTSPNTDLSGAGWSQLGATQPAAGTIHSGSAPVWVGLDGDTGAGLVGKVYSVEIRNSSDTVVANPSFATQPAETTSFADDAGLTWTLAGDAAIVTVVPATEEIATVNVQRSIDGGEWVTVLTDIVLDPVTHTATVQDTVPATVGTNTYRAVAFSALPSSVVSAEAEVTTSETTWGYLSGGAGFATVARFRAMPSYAGSTSRAKALYHFAGRTKPVQLAGDALTYTLSVSGKLSDGSGSAADFEALGQAEGVVCWRGPDGRRLFASLDKMSTGTTYTKALPTVAFTLTEVDFTEGDQ